jgi:hypothetical protein
VGFFRQSILVSIFKSLYMKRSIFLGIAGVATLLAGAGCQSINSTSLSSSSQIMSTETLSQTYTNKTYGFSFNYPEAVTVLEEGPNDAEKDYEAKKMISGTVTPQLDTITVQRKSGEILMAIKVPNVKAFPIVSENGEWDQRACGNAGLGNAAAPQELMVSGKKSVKVITTYSDTGVEEVYHCINVKPYPLILISSITEQPLVEKIIKTFSFTNPSTSSSSLTLIKENKIPSLVNSSYKDEIFPAAVQVFPVNKCEPQPSYSNHIGPCTLLDKVQVSSSLKLDAHIVETTSTKKDTITLDFLKENQPLTISKLTINSDILVDQQTVSVTFLNEKAIYVDHIGYKGITTHYYFNGTKWQTLNLADQIKSELTTDYELPLAMEVNDKYIHVWEAEYAELGSAMGGVEQKRTTHQQFILDRNTLKVLWKGTFPKAS